MKNTVLSFAVLCLSMLLLYAFAQIKSFNTVSLKIANQSTCSVAEVINNEIRKDCSQDSLGQKIIEETIPKFHQQLSAFSPF